jgi:hypothetical protein
MRKPLITRKRFEIFVAVGLVAAYVAVFFAYLPHVCPPKEVSKPVTYKLVIDGNQTQDASAKQHKGSIKASIAGSVGKVHADGSAEPIDQPSEKPQSWWLNFLCEANASDFAVGLFTLFLGIATYFLWQETARLARGADDQATKMEKSIAVAQKAANTAERAAKVAEQTLIASDRAWIQIKVELAGPLKFTSTSITAKISVQLKNVGRSPALHVRAFSKLHPEALRARTYAETVTRNKHSGALLGIGNVLFPNELTDQVHHTLDMQTTEFIAWIKETERSAAEHAEAPTDREPYTHARLGISIIAFYTLASDPKKQSRHTTMFFDLGRNVDPNIDGTLQEDGFDGTVGCFEMVDLRLEQAFLSGEAS